TARSMLSLGTEDFLAFWIASQSVGLPSGSPPPTLAATSMFLISLANSLPRLASLAAFWCLVVAHLEWPLIARRTPVLSGGATRWSGGPNCSIAAARGMSGGRFYVRGGRRPVRPARGQPLCWSESTLPSGSWNQATLVPLGEVHMPRRSCPNPS